MWSAVLGAAACASVYAVWPTIGYVPPPPPIVNPQLPDVGGVAHEPAAPMLITTQRQTGVGIQGGPYAPFAFRQKITKKLEQSAQV
jgi:hypothetical protein